MSPLLLDVVYVVQQVEFQMPILAPLGTICMPSPGTLE